MIFNHSTLRTFPPLFLDFETTGIEKGWAVMPDNRLVLACWKQSGIRYHCFGDQFHQQELVEAVRQAPLIVAHNAKFELQWLRRMGCSLIDLPPVFCTMIAHKVRASNRVWPLSLDLVAKHYGLPGKHHAVHDMIQDGVCPSDIPESLLLAYCQQDVDVLEAVFSAELAHMSDPELALTQTRCELVPVLADIEFNGMQLDAERVRVEYDKQQTARFAAERTVETLAPGVNWNSSQQVAKLLYEDWKIPELTDRWGNPLRTETGRPKTDADTLSKLCGHNRAARRFLKAKQKATAAASLLSKYLTKMQEYCAGPGVLYASFNQCRTVTGRLSSTGAQSKMQFQNIYREYKKLFRAREGCVLVGADGSQIEFRVAADLGHDPQALADITSGYPIHQRTADILTAAGQPTSYQEAKEHTFKPLYGGTSGTPAEVTYYKAFQERYPGVYHQQMTWVKECIETGKYTLPWGVTFYFPGTKATTSGYVPNSSNIFNYPIQALATAEIIPIVLVGVWRDLQAAGLGARIVNTVHDDIEIEAPTDEVEAVKKILVDNFTNKCYTVLRNRYNYEFKVPLGCGIKSGSHWGEGSEIKYEATI